MGQSMALNGRKRAPPKIPIDTGDNRELSGDMDSDKSPAVWRAFAKPGELERFDSLFGIEREAVHERRKIRDRCKKRGRKEKAL